jgi:peptidoglycan-associated lipoprotein
MNIKFLLALLAIAALTLSGCASKVPEGYGGEAGAATTEGGEGMQGAETYGLGADGTFPEGFDFVNDPQSPLNDPQSPLAQRIIYFDFDSSTVRDEYLEVVAAHGKFLAEHPDLRVRLEGHTDERGTREYNVALGERRAKAVQSLIELQGVSDRIEIVSYGEELPIAFGHDEESWGKNRRVEIVYEGK